MSRKSTFYQRKDEVAGEIKECEELLNYNDDISLATLDVLEALDIQFPECPPEEDTTIYDAAEVILEFMPQINERIKNIEYLMFYILNPEFKDERRGGFGVQRDFTDELRSLVQKKMNLMMMKL